MQWNNHSNLEGCHAFLGASSYHWLNYSDEKMAQVYKNHLATLKGTELHAFACQAIKLRQKLPKSNKTLNQYVNDAIGFGMDPEVLLYYSEYCFGTADAIKFDEKKSFLRIHDLKTGIIPAHLHQLEVYASLFCLEYDVRPGDIEIELRIYQNDDILIGEPKADVIAPIMDKIVRFDQIIRDIRY